MGRRNLTPEQISYLRGKRYIAEKKEVGAPIGNFNAEKQTHQNDEIVSTAEKLAEEYKVGKATIERDGQFARAVDKLSEIFVLNFQRS